MIKLEPTKWLAKRSKFAMSSVRGPTTEKRRAFIRGHTFSRISAYELAVLSTILAWSVDTLLGNRFNHSSGGLYIAAAFISTWFGGLGPGVLAIALTTVINAVLFDHPDLAFAVGVHGFDPLLFFVVTAALVSVIKHLNSKLEEKVEKRTSALNEANQRLEAFCYTLAHDLKAPLRSIDGFAHMIITDYAEKLDGDGKEVMERIRNSAERMSRLIVDLLAYTRLTRDDFRMQTVDVETVWQTVLQTFANEIKIHNAEVSSNLPLKYVQGDSIGIERILVNLLGNALKFTRPDRVPRIRLFSENKHPYVRIALEDNGIGVDPRYHDRIFRQFERLAPTGAPGGTGMGLAIVKRSVEVMGGRTGVKSTPGQGSCFWFEMPASSSQPCAARKGKMSDWKHGSARLKLSARWANFRVQSSRGRREDG